MVAARFSPGWVQPMRTLMAVRRPPDCAAKPQYRRSPISLAVA